MSYFETQSRDSECRSRNLMVQAYATFVMGLQPKSMKTLERSRTQRKLVAHSIIIHWHWMNACSKFNPQTADALAWWISWFPRTNDTNDAHENTLVPNAHSVMCAVTMELYLDLCRELTVTTGLHTGVPILLRRSDRIGFNTKIWDCVFYFFVRRTRFWIIAT